MILKNISPLPQLVNTINWKEVIESGKEFYLQCKNYPEGQIWVHAKRNAVGYYS